MAFPTDLADVVAGGNITASRNNAITAKIGIDNSGVSSSIDYLIKSTSAKLGKIASLSDVAGNYIIGSGSGASATWTTKTSTQVVADLGLTSISSAAASASATDKYISFGAGTDYDAVTTVEVRADLFTLGSDATGDVFYRNASGILTRLGVGSATEVLTLAGSPALPTWAAAGGGSSAFTEQVTIETGTDPALEVDQTSTGNIVDFQKSGTTKVYITDDGAIVVPEDTAGGKVQFGTDSLNRIRGSDGNNCMYVGPSNVAFYSGSEIRDIGTLNGVSTIKQLSGGYGSGLALTSMAAGGSSIDQPMTFAAGAQVATGDQIAFNFSAEITKATSGNYTGLKLNVTETDVNAGNLLLDLQVGGSTVFNLDPDGIFAINSSSTAFTINQSGAGAILDLQDGGTSRLIIEEDGRTIFQTLDSATGEIGFKISCDINGADGYVSALEVHGDGASKFRVKLTSSWRIYSDILHMFGGNLQDSNDNTWSILNTGAGSSKMIFWKTPLNTNVKFGVVNNEDLMLDAAGASNQSGKFVLMGGYVLHASNDEVLFDLASTVNKAAGDFTGIKSNITLTGDGFGTGTAILLDLHVGGASKFRVNETGTPIVPLQTPSSASDTGTVGMIKWDAGYIYVCTATNTWERVAVAAW